MNEFRLKRAQAEFLLALWLAFFESKKYTK